MEQSSNSVSFKNVEIIELPYTLGDNPCVSSGVPISASWYAQKRTTFNVDFFERYRPKRRSKLELHLPKEARKHLMLQAGFTLDEISAAARDAAIIRKRRFDTLNQLRARLQALMADEDPTKYGLPPHSSRQLHQKQQLYRAQEASPLQSPRQSSSARKMYSPYYEQQQQQQQQQPRGCVSPPLPPSPLTYSPKRKRSDRFGSCLEPVAYQHHYDQATKRLRSPIQTRSAPRFPCSPPHPSYLPTPQRMIDRFHMRPLVPPQRILSPPKLPYQARSVPRPL